LFDGNGEIIAEWCERAGNAIAALTIDSREVRARFKLGDFAGQLFIHVAGAAGHDVVKYALDTFGESGLVIDGALSCTHDANAWPSDRYAGLPAPAPGERVILWVQNSHPTPIPAGAIALNPMGEGKRAAIAEPIGPFASLAIDVVDLVPVVAWARRSELRAGQHNRRLGHEYAAAMPPRRALGRMGSTRCSSTATSRNPILAGRRGSRPGCSCGSARRRTIRCAI